jgi:hypothetical protein
MVRRKGPLPERWSGTEGAMSGAKAITCWYDRWFAENSIMPLSLMIFNGW